MNRETNLRSAFYAIGRAALRVFVSYSILFFLGDLILHLVRVRGLSMPPLSVTEIGRMLGFSLFFGVWLAAMSCFFSALRLLVPLGTKPPRSRKL
jgi:hypothetical protein